MGTIAGMRCAHPVRVAIDGVDAAGKTSLADELVIPLQALGRPVIRASVDGFHNPRSIRYRRGADSPEGYFRDSFNYDALRCSLLVPLGPGGSLLYRPAVFDWRKDSEIEVLTRLASPESILLLDGVFFLRPELRDFWDLRIWVEASFEVAVGRAELRQRDAGHDVTGLRERYGCRYVPGQRLYMAECRPREQADVVVDNNDLQNPRLARRVRPRSERPRFRRVLCGPS